MKRHTLALLLHPFKNGLLPRPLLRESIDGFFEILFAMHQRFPQLRLNLVIPGYFLECLDPMHQARLRDMCNRAMMELICTGYTEPFASLSPPELTIENIRHGLQVIKELTGQTPFGFLPPFSNWEPSLIGDLRAMGLRYTLLSNELFPEDTKKICGYWVAEHAGSSIGLVGTNVLNSSTTGPDFIGWLQDMFAGADAAVPEPFLTLHFLIPIRSDKSDESYRFLERTIESVEKNLLNFQPVCIGDLLSTANPAGLQYIPGSLQLGRRGAVDLHFLNYLFSFHQVGFMQRKLLDIYDRLPSPEEDDRSRARLLHDLFFVQDINRFLPGNDAGFELHSDRETTYSRLIAIDRQIHARARTSGGRVRITDFLRNGGKTIILSNSNIKAFIDHLHGGQIIGFDFRRQGVNLCSVYNPSRLPQPDINVPGASRTWFLDRILPAVGTEWDSSSHLSENLGDFNTGSFDYKIRKSSGGINVSLIRAGSFLQADHPCPLHVEKILGLERDNAQLLFIYQISNPSLMQYHFTFSTEINLFLPGIASECARLRAGDKTYERTGLELLRIPSVTAWDIEDPAGGIRFHLETQKPLTLWCLPPEPPNAPIEGLRLVMTFPVVLEPSAHTKITGKIFCKSTKKTSRTGDVDAI